MNLKNIKNMIFIVLIFTSMYFLTNLLASDEYFKQANDLYAQKNYSAAAELYQKLVDQGLASKELFFNLSNAYYKNGQVGLASLYNEKAFRVAPRDFDIKYNRKIINKLHDRRFISWLELKAIFSILGGGFFLLLTFSLYFKNRKLFWTKIVIFMLLFITFSCLYYYYYSDYRYPKAIVISHEAIMRAEPNEDSQSLLTILEANQVLIYREKNDWINIYAPDQGIKGWTERTNLGKI
ncbi:MAG: tetratricopeptide repeat protein [bacterium]|nr:tetratricopeptide repeat protein [bacterium]